MQAPRRVALVTGGNRGLGLELCRRLGHLGYHVVLTSRDYDKGRTALARLESRQIGPNTPSITSNLDQPTQDLPQSTSSSTKFPHVPPPSPIFSLYSLDISNPDSVSSFLRRFRSDFDRLDLLINNAGIYLSSWTREQLDASMQTNLFGPIQLMEGLMPLFLDRGHGRIVNMSSTYGRLAFISRHYRLLLSPENDHTWTDSSMTTLVDEFKARIGFIPDDQKMKGSLKPGYQLSKAALNTWTRLLDNILEREHRLRLKGHKLATRERDILVNCCCPGWVRTEMGGADAPLSVEEGADTPMFLATELAAGGPSGKFWRDRKVIDWI